MKRVIADYHKLAPPILKLLKAKYPDGYSDTDIVVFKNAKNETIKAVEVKTEDTMYLVKISRQMALELENFEGLEYSEES